MLQNYKNCLIVFLVIISGVGSLKATEIDDELVRMYADGITRDDLIIGHLRNPEIGEIVRSRRWMGKSIYRYDGAMTNMPPFQILDTLDSVAGRLEAFVFLTYGRPNRLEFINFPEGSNWIIVLKPALGGNLNLISSKVSPNDAKSISAFPFINDQTFFDVYRVDGRYAAVVTTIAAGKASDIFYPVVGAHFVEDLGKINDHYINGSSSALSHLFSELKTEYGIAVANKIFGAPKNLGVLTPDEEPIVEVTPAPPVEEVAEVPEKVTAPEPTIEEPVEVVITEPLKESAKQSSQWWLWLIGALVVVGGLGLVLRKKS